MRRNRGSAWVWLLWLLPLFLEAQTRYAWSVTQSKTSAAAFEAVAVEYTCRFDTEGYEYIIAFNPPKETDDYRLVLESAGEQIVDEKRINTYRYILFPKRAGELKLAFSASMEHTTKASIENTTIGRDNVEKIDYTAVSAALPAVSVAVSPHGARYAGHLELRLDTDKKTVEAYTPVQVRVSLEGYGNIDGLKPFTLDIPGAKVFTDGEQKQLTLGDNGFEGSITQQFAVVSDHDFTIPALQLVYYDTVRKTEQTLAAGPIAVAVTSAPAPAAGQPSEKTVEGTEAAGGGWSWLHLVVALVAGIVIGRFLLPVETETDGRAPLPQKLKQCRDPGTFAAYLAMLDADRYRGIIDEIEGKLRRGEKVDLRQYRRFL